MTESDFEIIQKILRGDEKAFSTLIQRHKDKAMVLALRMLKNNEDAEEVLQDAFISAFKGLQYFEWKSSFSTWFYRIVYNLCCNALKKNKKHSFQEQFTEEYIDKIDHNNTDFEFVERYENDEIKNIIKKEIENLDPIYSSILTLFYVQELGYEEIVNITGCPLGTVKTRLSRGRNILNEKIMKRFAVNSIKELENIMHEK